MGDQNNCPKGPTLAPRRKHYAETVSRAVTTRKEFDQPRRVPLWYTHVNTSFGIQIRLGMEAVCSKFKWSFSLVIPG